MPFYTNNPISFKNCLAGEGRGKRHPQNWPSNIIQFPSCQYSCSKPKPFTESLKTRLIIYTLSPCCRFWNMNDLSCSHKGHLEKPIVSQLWSLKNKAEVFKNKHHEETPVCPLPLSSELFYCTRMQVFDGLDLDLFK